MNGRGQRATRNVQYDEEVSTQSSDSHSSNEPRAPRGSRFTAKEAARQIANLNCDDDSHESSTEVEETRERRSGGSTKGKTKPVSSTDATSQENASGDEESQESDSEDWKASSFARVTRASRSDGVAKKPTCSPRERRTRSARTRDDFEEEVMEYKPEERKRRSPKPRADPAPAKRRPVTYAAKPKNKFVDTEEDKKKRLEYLLKQSETFAHVMTSGDAEDKPKERRGRKRADAEEPSSSQDHRHARRGSSEDEELAKRAAEAADFTRFEKTPFYIQGGSMRDYQVRGLNWLISLCENNINGILADEMGLGKTLQTIALLGYMYSVKKSDLPHLVIAPKSTLSNWQAEFKRWCPTLESAVLIGNPDERNEFMKAAKTKRTWDVLVTSYEIAMREQTFIRKFFWGYLVIDEAHRIKNEGSLLATIVRTIRSSRRLLLTGTPLQNNLHELWALLNFLLPDIFESAQDFDSWFNDQECQTDMSLVERLHSILRPFLLRRVKAEVEKDLPPKTEIKLFVGLAPLQRTWYRNILLKDISVLNAMHGIGSSSLQNILMHLRKCCNHPYLFEGAEPGPPYTTDRHIVDNCGKMILLDKLLIRLKERGSRVLIFSQMTRTLDILEDYCGMVNYNYCRLDGSTAHTDREEYIRDFNAPGSDKFIFLLSTRAGGLGINLTSADTVVLYDSDWNPQVDLQAMDRVHRIGQTKPVTVFRLVTEKTVEERIIERAERKMRLDALVIQSGRLVEQTKGLGKEEMQQMIRFGAQAIIHTTDVDITNITNDDIDTILEKGKVKTEELNKKLGDLNEAKLRTFANDFTAEGKSVYQWEGQDYREQGALASKLEDMEKQWISLPKRERKQLYDLSGATSSRHVYGSGRESPPWQPPPKEPKKAPIPRPANIRFMDIHFPPARLVALIDQEMNAYKKATGFKHYIHPDQSEEDKTRLKAAQDAIDSAVPLTPEDERERITLLHQTFMSWKRNDIALLLRGIDQYGPTNVEKIAESMKESKSVAEVKRYLPVFLERYESLVDGPKIRVRIQRGILNQDKQRRRRDAVKIKMAETGNPQMDMKIPYPAFHKPGLSNSNANNARSYWFEEEDRFLLYAYGVACETFPEDSDEMILSLRDSLRSSPQFKFDYQIRSITAEKVKERLEILLNWVVREIFPQTSVTKMPPLPVKSTPSQNLPEPVPSTSASPPKSAMSYGGTSSSSNFTLKYVDPKEGKFVVQRSQPQSMMPAAVSSPSSTVARVSVVTPTVDLSGSTTTPKKISPVHQPKVLTLSPSGSKGSPVVTARPAALAPSTVAIKLKSPPNVPAGKKIPVWAMIADSSASRSASSAKPLQLKRKAPNDPDSDDDIVEVYASVKRAAPSGDGTSGSR